MMGTKERKFAPLVQVSLEELVPQDHFYRRLEGMLDLSFVRDFVQETYAGLGRPSIDPIITSSDSPMSSKAGKGLEYVDVTGFHPHPLS